MLYGVIEVVGFIGKGGLSGFNVKYDLISFDVVDVVKY